MRQRTKWPYEVVATCTRIVYEGFYYVVLPDNAAGRRNAYSVYRVPSSPSRRIRVVGRELPFHDAMALVKKLERLRSTHAKAGTK